MAILKGMEQRGMRASNTDSNILIKHNKLNLYFVEVFLWSKILYFCEN